MSENENVTDIEVIEDEPISGLPIQPSEPEAEIPMEKKKKAVNVEDLVFVRQYIDKKMVDEVPGLVIDALKGNVPEEEEDEDFDFSGFYTKTEADETFYKKTDTVAEAMHATIATNAENANYAESAVEATHATSADSAVHATSADSATNATEATYAVNAYNAELATYAVNAGHATNATSADSAEDAKTLNGHTVSKGEDGYLKFDEADVTVANAVSASEATYAAEANHALNADDSKKVNGAELKLDEAGYLMNGETEVSVYKAGEAASAEWAKEAGIADDAKALNGHDISVDDNGLLTFDNSDVYVQKAATLNGYTVEIDDDGLLKIGGIIVPQKREMQFTVTDDGDTKNLVFNENINTQDKLEFIISTNTSQNTPNYASVIVLASRIDYETYYTITMNASSIVMPRAFPDAGQTEGAFIDYVVLDCESYDTQTNFNFSLRRYHNSSKNGTSVTLMDGRDYTIEKIYKIID